MRKRHYPPKLKVGKSNYHVQLIPLDATTAGYCEDGVKLIALDPAQSDRELFATFVHEIIHAAEKEHGFRLSHRRVEQLEAALAQVLWDNFHLLPKR